MPPAWQVPLGFAGAPPIRDASLALGARRYASAPSLVAALTRDQRRELVSELSDEGMSTRAIAPIVGAGMTTVKRDLAESPGPNGPPDAEPRQITGRDGKTYSAPSSSSLIVTLVKRLCRFQPPTLHLRICS